VILSSLQSGINNKTFIQRLGFLGGQQPSTFNTRITMAEATVLQVFRSQVVETTTTTTTTNSVKLLKKNINNACLCPSMDLIMIKNSYDPPKSTTTTNVKIFNTIDRREVATLQLPLDNSSSNNNNVDDDNSNNYSNNIISCFAWSPNGQSVAVVVTNISTSAVEPLTAQRQGQQASNNNNYTSSRVFLFHILTAQDGGESLEPYHSFTVKGIVQNVTWCMVGKDLPYRWMYTHEEEEQGLTWR
jgi:hypothetical protein